MGDVELYTDGPGDQLTAIGDWLLEELGRHPAAAGLRAIVLLDADDRGGIAVGPAYGGDRKEALFALLSHAKALADTLGIDLRVMGR